MYPELQFETWSLSTYFLILSLNFCFMLIYLRYRAKKLGFTIITVLDLGIFSSIFGFLGARLLHVFYENPIYYWNNPLTIFKFWEGGYVYFGGLISGIASGLLYLKIKRLPIFPYLDLFAPILALGYSVGRLACLFQGCCYGRKTDSIWGMNFLFLREAGEEFARHPTQAYASLGELLLYFILIILESKKKGKLKAGTLFSIWFIGHGVNRMFMEIFRDDPRGPLMFGMGISFWLSILITLFGLGLILSRRPCHP